MNFCKHCGNLLDLPGIEDKISCSVCGEAVGCSVFDGIDVVTSSSSPIFQPRVTLDASDSKALKDGATIKEKCPKCDATEMTFHTMQLRSADEGQTVFYSCKKCGYKYSINS